MSNFSIPKKTFLLIPQGTYRAVITSLDKATGAYGEQVRIVFHVITEGIEGLEYTDGSVDLLAWCPMAYSDKSKLFRWSRAALAGEFDPAADFNSAKLVNKKVLISVEKNISASGGEFNKIVDVMAMPHGKTKATPSQGSEPFPPPDPSTIPDDIPW